MASSLRPRRPINVALVSESCQIACGGRHKDRQREELGDRWGIGRSERDDWEVSLTSKRERKQKQEHPRAAALSLLPRRPSRSSRRQVAVDLTGRGVVRGGRGSSREEKERGKQRLLARDRQDRGAAAEEGIGLRPVWWPGGFVAWASPLLTSPPFFFSPPPFSPSSTHPLDLYSPFIALPC